jgi:hypothetical protein
MAIQVFSWLSTSGSQINKIANKTVPHIILPRTIFKVWIRNICEISPIQDQCCQLLSKFVDNMD